MTTPEPDDRVANQLAVPAPSPLGEHWRTAQLLARSHYFHDGDPNKDLSPERAFTKILAGAEWGFGPIASLRSVFIVKDQVTYSATLVGARIQNSGRYRYRVQSLDNNGCVLIFFERSDGGWLKLGESSFNNADAKAAGLTNGVNWQRYPRNMYFARALTNGARWYCPDIFAGAVYTPDEMGATVDDDGEVIEIPAAPARDQAETERLAKRHTEIFSAQEPPPERSMAAAGLTTPPSPVEIEAAMNRNANLLQLAYESGVKGLRPLTAQTTWPINRIEEVNLELAERIKSRDADLDQQFSQAQAQLPA